jgi:hypothetical protein
MENQIRKAKSENLNPKSETLNPKLNSDLTGVDRIPDAERASVAQIYSLNTRTRRRFRRMILVCTGGGLEARAGPSRSFSSQST